MDEKQTIYNYLKYYDIKKIHLMIQEAIFNLVTDSNTPSKILSLFAYYCSIDIRFAVGLNTNADVNTLVTLSKDKCYKVRMAVALNINTPLFILKRLARDHHYEVKLSVLKNDNCTSNIFKFLSNDKNNDIRFFIAYSDKTPLKTLKKLSKDRAPGIKIEVEENKKFKYGNRRRINKLF